MKDFFKKHKGAIVVFLVTGLINFFVILYLNDHPIPIRDPLIALGVAYFAAFLGLGGLLILKKVDKKSR